MSDKPVIELCIDSGAYSAYTQKKEVNLANYCDFLLANDKHITHSVCLDVIDPQGPDIAAAKGWDNYLYMRDRGLHPMPVFHAREKKLWLDKMLDMTDYVGLSGTSLVSPAEDRAWHRIIWDYVTDRNGFPIAKFHSFGNTSMYTLMTYPFYSADSATWMIQSGRAARVKLGGKAYQLRSNSIGDNNYIDNNDPLPKKQAWQDEMRVLGLDPDRVMDVVAKPSELAMIRSYLVASDTLRLQEATRSVTRYKAPKLLVGDKKQDEGGVERLDPCKVYFVVSPAAYYFNYPIIAALGIKRILVSYYYIVTSPKIFWEERFLPFIYDPQGFCERDPKVRQYWDKLNECITKAQVVAV